MNFSFCIRKLAVAFYMINEIQPKIKFQNTVQCPFKENLSFKQVSDIHDDEVESIFVEINLPNTKPVAVGTVYRPSDSTVDYVDKIDVLFQNRNSIYDDVYILGDFNLDINKACNLRKVSHLTKILKCVNL